MRRVILTGLILGIAISLFACKESAGVSVESEQAEDQSEGNEEMKIKITVNDTVLTATMDDNAASRDFIAMLPLDITLDDYAGTEKIYYLPKELSTEGAPSGSDPSIGDITYYAPWGNLAIFYKDFGYASGLIILGRIDGGIGKLKVQGSVKVKIELLNQ